MARVKCPVCHLGFRIKLSATSTKGVCPRCRARLVTPALPAGDEAPESAPPRRRYLLGTVLTLLVVLIVLGWSLKQGPAGPADTHRPRLPREAEPKAAEKQPKPAEPPAEPPPQKKTEPPREVPKGKLGEAFVKAREQAAAWKKDAPLVLIFLQLDQDGAVTSSTFNFASDTAGEQAQITIAAGAEPKLTKLGYQPRSLQPLPVKFRDLADALAQARKAGMAPGTVQATLRMTSDGCAWEFLRSGDVTVYYVEDEGPALTAIQRWQQQEARRLARMVPADPDRIARLIKDKFGAPAAEAVKIEVGQKFNAPLVKLSGQVASEEVRRGIVQEVEGRVSFPRTIDTQELEALSPAVYHTHSTPIASVAFSPDGKLLAVGSVSTVAEFPADTVKVREVATGKQVAVLPHKCAGSVAFSPDGKVLATASFLNDWTVKLWDVGTWKLLATPAGMGPVAFSPDGKTLTTSTRNNAVLLWDVAGGRVASQIKVPYVPPDGPQFSVDAASGQAKWPHHALAFCPDGTRLYWQRVMMLVEYNRFGESFRKSEPTGEALPWMALAPDGDLLATGSQDGIVLWDEDGRPTVLSSRADVKHPTKFTGFYGEGEFYALPAGGKAVGFGRNRLDLTKLAVCKGCTLGAVAFSPDGKTLAVGGGTGTVTMLDVARSMKQGKPVLVGARVGPPVTDKETPKSADRPMPEAKNPGNDKPPEKKAIVVSLEGLKATAPAEWKPIALHPDSSDYSFQLPKVEGDDYDARLTIAHDPTAAFSAADSINRMVRSFVPPPGKRADEMVKTARVKVGDMEATYLDVQGDYRFVGLAKDKAAGAEVRPGWRYVGVVFPTGRKGGYDIRLIGPAKTVEKYKQGFDEWLKALR